MAKKEKTVVPEIVDSVEALEAKMKAMREAQKVFATFTQEQVDKIFYEAAMAANKQRIPLAKMAVEELKDFLENGNIKNSVNFPNCDMGTCVAVGRIAITHKNIPNMISQLTKILGAEGLNIADMTNKSKGEYAYTLIDLESAASAEALDALKAIEGVSKVRVVK